MGTTFSARHGQQGIGHPDRGVYKTKPTTVVCTLELTSSGRALYCGVGSLSSLASCSRRFTAIVGRVEGQSHHTTQDKKETSIGWTYRRLALTWAPEVVLRLGHII